MILSRENLNHIGTTNVELPEPRIFSFPEKVLQFGTGVLLRGLPDYFIDQANKQGIFNGRVAVVKSTGTSTVEFDAQDSLYTLCIRGLENGKHVSADVISAAISRVIAADENWQSVLAVAATEELQLIVSNTTEVGIQLIKENIHQNPPKSFPAKLLAVLHRRFQAFDGSPAAGLVIIATELIADNGKKLREIVIALAQFNNLEDEFLAWLNDHNRFCNSLVDRIVPGKPDPSTLASLQAELGYADQLLAMCEPYSLWAIEGDEKVADVLTFAQVNKGVIIAKDIEVYRELKVRLLNGTHTLSSGIAFLSGIDTVKKAMNDEYVKTYIDLLMETEIANAIPYQVTAAQTTAFANTVKDRFANPAIEHLWLNITFQYTMKMKVRIMPLLLNHYKLHGTIPTYMAFGFASYLRFMKIHRKINDQYVGSYQNMDYSITDDAAAYFFEKINANPSAYPLSVLQDAEFWGADLNSLPQFVKAVHENYLEIENTGIRTALTTLTSAKLAAI